MSLWPVGRSGSNPLWARLLVALPLLLPGASLDAQTMDSREESRLLREASALEWRGRVDEAQEVLTRLLAARPTSSGALFALERILRNQGRVADVLPWADRFLEADPAASGVRYMKLRVLAETDSLDAMAREARNWFQAEPGSPDPYREVARLYQRVLGEREALAVLRQGREDLGRPDALAVEMGDLLAALGDGRAAVDEWARALGDPEADLTGILRRIERLEGDPVTFAPPLLEALSRPPSTPQRRAAAVRVALQLGIQDQALRLAAASASALSGTDRRAFLEEVARRADEAGLPGVALWALEEEREMAPSRERPTLDVRIAALALQAGDTARAVAARTRLARSLPVGSVERRQVMAELVRVEAFSASRETLLGRLEAFDTEYPDAPELDELRALVASGLAARGDEGTARSLVAAAPGPLTALESGYLHFQARELDGGKALMEEAIPGLSPSRATGVLHLLSSLDRLGSEAAGVVAHAAAEAHYGRASSAIEELVASLPGLPDEDRPPVIAWAGEQAASAGQLGRAEEFYATVVDAYPEAREFPDAALALARLRLDRGDHEAARRVLERLILEWPDSPVVPAARRELQKIRSGVGALEEGPR